MTSYCRRHLNFGAHERPTVGDTKISFTQHDHLGWILCDGALLSKAEYELLFNVIGYSYGGSGDQFALPDPRGCVPGIAARSTVTHSYSTITTATSVRPLGAVLGEEVHVLTIDEMPAHKHGSVDVSGNSNGNGNTTSNGVHSHNINTANAGATVPTRVGQGTDNTVEGPASTEEAGSHAHTMGSTGGSNYHNNMQPTLFVGNMFIYTGKTQYGSFPYTTGLNLA
jgi:microcystin-dependent protein